MPGEWLTRVRFLLLPKRHDEVDEELRFHLDEQARAHVEAGRTVGEARRLAAIEFGGVENVRAEAHRQRPGFRVELFVQDAAYAVRGFRRNPVFTVTVVATLMLGIGVTAAVFSVVDHILFRPLPYADAGRLVSVGLVQSLEPTEFMVGGFYFDWRDTQKPFVAMSAESAVPNECDLTEENPAQLSCARMEASFLPMLGVAPVIGRNFLAEEDRPNGPRVAMISYGTWMARYSGDPQILGRMIKIDGEPVQVVGVLPRSFELPSLHAADVIFPLVYDVAKQRASSPGIPLRVFARLRPGVSVEQARDEMEPQYQSALRIIPAGIRKEFHLKVRSLRDRQMQEFRLVAWVLLGTVLAVLMIACANVASLLMARGAARQRELAVRSALGASRARLVSQALTEAMMLSAAGGVAGYALARALLHIFLALAPVGIPYLAQVRLDWRIVGFTMLLALVCGLMFGVASTWQKPRLESLGGRVFTASRATARQWLVVGQIAASMVLLAGAMLLLRSFWNLEKQQLGMATGNTLAVSLTLGRNHYGSNEKKMDFFRQLTERLQYGPGVGLVAVADSVPPAANHNQRRLGSIGVDGRAPSPTQEGGSVMFRWVSPEYFAALQIPILQGRGFTEEEMGSSEHFVVLSQQLAGKLFPRKNPIGERLQLDMAPGGSVGDVVAKGARGIVWYTVVGVAADVKNGGLGGEELPEYYQLRRNRAEDWDTVGAWGGTSVVVMRTAVSAETLTPWIRAQVAALDPTLPVDIETMQQRVSKLADQPRFQTMLVGFFAATGLLLAVIGLYGVIAFLVTQRTREIAVRMALGATRRDILGLVLGRSLRLIVMGTGVGLVAALALSRVLGSLLFSVGPHDPTTFGVVTVGLVGIAAAAAWVPARAAMRVDPMVALRCE